MKRYSTYFAFFYFIISVFTLNAQKLEIVDIMTDNYPEITARFFLYDNSNEIFRDFNSGDIKITDNSIEHTGEGIFCTPLHKFSSILTIDISYSMNKPLDSLDIYGKKRIDLARAGAKIWIDSLPSDRSECALTSFNYNTKIDQIFTTDKNLLKEVVDTATAEPKYGTNYNGAFLVDNLGTNGALELARTAQYKPVLVFLTDGAHDAGAYGEVEVDKIIDLAEELNATIYCITIGLPMPSELIEIANATKGRYYSNLNDEESVNAAYLEILREATALGTPIPCEVSWETNCDGGDIDLSIPEFGISAQSQYEIPEDLKPYPLVSTRDNYFINEPAGKTIDRILQLTAKNNYLAIDSYTSNDSNFEITNWGGSPPPFRLGKDSVRYITVSYEAYEDSSQHPAIISFEGSGCDSMFINMHGGRRFSHDFFAGIIDTFKTKSVTLEEGFCNTGGYPARIDAMQITGKNADEFKLVDPPLGLSVLNNNCKEIKIDFTPKELGMRTAVLEIVSGNYRIKSKLSGIGAGKPDLHSPKEFNLRITNCVDRFVDTTIYLLNTGADILNIEDIMLDGPDVYELIDAPDTPLELGMLEKLPLKLRFTPLAAGTENATITVNSDAFSGPNYIINIIAKKDSINFELETDTIDLGIICPFETKNSSIKIKNTGDVLNSFKIEATHLELSQSSIEIPANSDYDFSFKARQSNEGTYLVTLSMIDSICGIVRESHGKYIVEYPKLETGILYLVSQPGKKKDTVLVFKNTTLRDITIDNIQINDQVFSYSGISLPLTIEPDSSLELPVSYYPLVEEIIDAEIIFSGSPCDFEQQFNITGNPSLSVADIVIEEHENIVGKEIDIPLLFRESHNFSKSRTDGVSLKIKFDGRLLEAIGPTLSEADISQDGDFTILSFEDLWVDSLGQDQTLATLNFEVKNGPKDETELEIYDIKGNAGKVYFVPVNGIFRKIRARAIIRIDSNFAAEPGELIDIPIYLQNAADLSDFHESISASIRFNATLIEPIGNTPRGTVENGFRTIPLKDMPLPQAPDSILTFMKFRAMLGNSEYTALEILDAETKYGLVEFNEIPGRYRLIIDDTSHLFDPFRESRYLSPYPNPTIGLTYIKFELSEPGYSKLSLHDYVGREVEIISHKLYKAGIQEASFNASKYSAGMYFLVLKTPTQEFVRRINIVR